MPGAQLNNKPLSAERFSDCTEESQLELHLQRQLEEDVARIYDESIFSDIEVVCGKLKILTHSCILKARTENFYRKLHTILHVNIERNTFEEIYSFISDVYTECNILHEEKDIISYLERDLNFKDFLPDKPYKEEEEPDVFSTPKCITPKEYYAIVPIEENLLEKELIEQDELSNAFNSISKSQAVNTSQINISQRNKPTSLPLHSSHTSKAVKHSSICDIFNKNFVNDEVSPIHKKNINTVIDKDSKTYQTALLSDTIESTDIAKNINNTNSRSEKLLDPPYSPDSLITDEPSSSSDYLSAAHTCSPGASLGNQFRVNIGNHSKMENIYTLSDSGLEDTGMLGSVNSHQDVSLTNMSLSENVDSSAVRSKQSGTPLEKEFNGKNINKEMCGKSLKEKKQRQNEEIVILESSSLSSETGSWESVYPPKLVEREICEKFLLNERRNCYQQDIPSDLPNAVTKSPFKSTPCFIDASSLVDEEETTIRLEILPTPSKPVPCSTVKQDISPVDWSESNDNEDSLEQAEKKDPDAIQRDLSPTIFEMTPLTEDSLSTNAFENASLLEQAVNLDEGNRYVSEHEGIIPVKAVIMTSTPHNSMMSLKTYKQYESEICESVNVVNSESSTKMTRKSKSPPIISGGASVEDHLLQESTNHESTSLPKFQLENMPIVTGAYLPQPNDHVQEKPRHYSASAWVVDMSSDPITEESSKKNHIVSDDTVVGPAEKKNIFSMYIDLGDKTTLKDMPARLSSSMNTRQNRSNPEKPKYTEHTEGDILTESSMAIFEKYETLCNDPNISISEIIAIPRKPEPIPELEDSVIDKRSVNTSRTHKSNDERTLEKDRHKESTHDLEDTDLFVKLSDLDKPVQKVDVDPIEAKDVDVRMTRSIPDWGEQAFSMNSRSIEVISSFNSENALSLNRLFPHLKSEFSRSMPGSLSSRARSPLRLGTSSTLGDADEQVSEMSEISSMQSSNCRSGFGNSTTTDSQTASLMNCTSRLGQDLLRMFLEEIAPDVIVEVSGKRFKAHKCILSSRCQYFAGILSGGWVESLGNVIVLPPFSYNVVYFALCHIYSGLATIPDSVSIVELATLADMLGLEGLKEAIMFTLKAKYCHHFHKPCRVCIVGVLECFPLCSVYGLDDLYHKCLKWITKYFCKVWPTKAFATLPTDLLDKCFQYNVVNLTLDNVIDTVYGCGIIAASLQKIRWSETVARMCRRLISAAAQFIAPKLLGVFKLIPSLFNEAPSAAKKALDNCVATAIEWAPPDEVCRAYEFLTVLVKERRNHHYSKPDLISNGTDTYKSLGQSDLLYAHACNWRLLCEGALVLASPRVVSTQAFKDLPSELRKRLRELGCIDYAHALPLTRPTHHQDRKSKNFNQSKKNNKASTTVTSTARNVDIAQVRASFVPYSAKPMIPVTSTETLKSNNDLCVNKKPRGISHPPQVRTTKAQEERAKFNKTKATKPEDKQNRKMIASRPPSFENTKPRYLEPKSKDKKVAVNKHLPKIDSSSESSRNSSPVHLRNMRGGPQHGRRGERELQAMSQDSLATSSRPRTAEPSTDSLSESQTSNKYATYTKPKANTKGSIDSIKTTRYQDPVQPSSNVNTKTKTKIPLPKESLNKTSKYKGVEYRNSREQKCGRMVVPKINLYVNNGRGQERKVPGSLMNATKSSSAKIVPKVVKDIPHDKMNPSNDQRSGHPSRHHRHEICQENENPTSEIPVMERSGTFLKDEPTFGADRFENFPD